MQISEQPLAFIHQDLITADEARHLIRLAAPRMKRSMVGGGHAITDVSHSLSRILCSLVHWQIKYFWDTLILYLHTLFLFNFFKPSDFHNKSAKTKSTGQYLCSDHLNDHQQLVLVQVCVLSLDSCEIGQCDMHV